MNVSHKAKPPAVFPGPLPPAYRVQWFDPDRRKWLAVECPTAGEAVGEFNGRPGDWRQV